jgi:NitT/TauT family transport system substrate-binding protein
MPVVNGYEIKIPLAIHTGCSVILAKESSGIKDPLDLIGKRVGVGSLNASAVVLLQRTLGMAGYKVVPPNADLEFVVFQSSDLPLAISNGSVDAVALGEPTATIAREEQGDLVVVLDSAISEYYRNEFCCTIQLRIGFVEDHLVAASKFVRAIQRASAYVQENPLKTAELMAEHNYVAGDPVRNGAILATYNYKATVSGARDAIARNLEEMVKIGVITEKIDPVELTNQLFVSLPNVPESLYEWVNN